MDTCIRQIQAAWLCFGALTCLLLVFTGQLASGDVASACKWAEVLRHLFKK